jgi:hypothetical protein
MKLIKTLHEALTDLTAEYPGIMWSTMIIDGIVLLYLDLMGINALGFEHYTIVSHTVMGVYGAINSIFYIVAVLYMVGDDPLEYEPTTEERRERYGKVIAPMLILFPILIPMWVGFLISHAVAFIGSFIYEIYKKLENLILK